jgi:(4S)-4-hydroxy-5-phosphonooxypentane-2,3-dione isomerase
MRKIALKPLLASAAVLATLAGASFTLLQSRHAAAEAGGVYINAIDLVIIPSELPKFMEAIKENAANSVKEPGVHEFNVNVLADNPNHVFLYEVYDNEDALKAHLQTPHFLKFRAATQGMVVDRNVRRLSVIAMNAKGH